MLYNLKDTLSYSNSFLFFLFRTLLTATIFASQLRSCDYIFDKKGKYLIFANYEPDTGFLYSDQCFFIKPFAEFSKDEWELLSKLGLSHRNSDVKNVNEGNIELVIDDLFNQPNRKITNLQQENEKLSKDNKTYRLVSIISILLLILFFVFIRKIKRIRLTTEADFFW